MTSGREPTQDTLAGSFPDTVRFKAGATGLIAITTIAFCLLIGHRAVAHQRSVWGAAVHAAGEPASAWPYLVNAARSGLLAGSNAAPWIELGEVAGWASGDARFRDYHRDMTPASLTRMSFLCYAAALARRPSSTGAISGLADLFRRSAFSGGALALPQGGDSLDRDAIDRLVGALYRKAIALEPGNYFWYAYLADFFRERGRDGEALPLYAKAIELMPDLGWHYYLGATGPIPEDLFQVARQGLEAALASNEVLPREKIESNIGYLHERQRDYAEALVHYRKAIEIANDPSQYFYQAALLFNLQKRPEDAEEYFRRALARGGLNARQELASRVQTGRLRLARGDARGAVEELSRARTMGPGAYDVRIDLGRAMVALGESRKAEAEYRQAMALDGTRPQAYAALIDLHVAEGDIALAIPLARRLTELYPNEPRHRERLDALYRGMGTGPSEVR